VLVAALGHPYGPSAERGVFRSTDGGRSWQQVLYKDDATGAIDLAFRPGDPSVVYAALWQTRRPPWSVYPPSSGPGRGLYPSRDGGRTFVPVKGAPGGDDYHEMWIDPEHPERRILGVDQGAVVSLDAGATWSSWYNQPTGQMYHVITDQGFPYHVYGAQQDSG